jgi:hypothetical protein
MPFIFYAWKDIAQMDPAVQNAISGAGGADGREGKVCSVTKIGQTPKAEGALRRKMGTARSRWLRRMPRISGLSASLSPALASSGFGTRFALLYRAGRGVAGA